ncbi:MAG: hypothetical protein KC613_07505 [Myxococcales bacterium]|nr:hypothetical protein [Myxococcales bacterium]MCB9525481.1 hypothetical protein [Myxococcales bacterium]
MRALTLLLCFASSAMASPQVAVWGALGDAAARPGPIEARLGEPVHLFAVVRHRGRWYSDAPRLRGVRRPRPLSDLGDVRVTWRLVEPRQHHAETPSPNPGNPAYSNSVLFGPRHGQWLGYDTLEYHAAPVAEGPRLTLTEARPSHPRLQAQGRGRGTVRYQAVVTLAGQAHASPGPEALQRGGISPRVFRVSFRGADDLVGWLESFYNVPNVFGSAGRGANHQTERHQGADCADVLVGAARKAGAKVPYTSVAGLGPHTDALTERLLMDADGLWRQTEAGRERVTLRFGRDVQAGDLLLIKYAPVDWTGRVWDHIGMLGPDGGVPQVFDLEDPVLHIGYLYGLVSQPARAHGVAVVEFRRLKRPYLRQMARRR